MAMEYGRVAVNINFIEGTLHGLCDVDQLDHRRQVKVHLDVLEPDLVNRSFFFTRFALRSF